MFRRIFILPLTLTVGLASSLQAAKETTRQSSTDIPALIQALADPDSAVRRAASDRLSDLPDARPQLLAAARSGDPEQRARAAEVLRKLPWYRSDDPPFIRSALESYGAAPTDEMRSTIIDRLAGDENGAPVLIRLLREETNELIRWKLVYLMSDDEQVSLRRYLREAPFQKRLRELDVSQDDPPVLVVCGKAWLERDRARGLGLFRRAIDTEQLQPSGDHGVLNIAYDALLADDLHQRQFDRAAELLRRMIPRDGTDERNRMRGLIKSPSLAALLALHRYFGPLKGWNEDLRTWCPDIESPTTPAQRVEDLLTQLGARPLPLSISDRLKMSPEDHLVAGSFLYTHKFLAAADAELQQALVASDEDPLHFTEYYASLMRGRIASEAGRDADAVEAFERCLRVKLQSNAQMSDDDIQMQVRYHRARVALAKGDHATADEEVRGLPELSPESNDETIAVIRWLKENRYDDAAKALFGRVFAQSQVQLDSEDFKAGFQNDIAWLCARCNEKLDLAVDLSKQAIEAMPESAAFLDTAAEANYAKGNRVEAIRLESRALELAPDNEFMHQQLERFQSGKP